MRVGQWCRFNDYEEGWGIGKITEIRDDYFYVDVAYYVSFKGDKYKTADNLEDLLEIGDIVHFKTLNGTGELIIKTEDRLNYLKFCVFNKQMIVTAIELHENRVKQVIPCE